jgi:hypothetical protein
MLLPLCCGGSGRSCGDLRFCNLELNMGCLLGDLWSCTVPYRLRRGDIALQLCASDVLVVQLQLDER